MCLNLKMECIIPGNNMKVLGKALQALSKIGDELYIDAREDQLSFITLNSSKTVCARFHLLETFFSSYDLSKDNSEPFKCKIHMKIFLPLFKGHLDKKLDFVKLEYTNESDFILFKMKYKCDNLLMVHNLRLMDSETLSVQVDTNSSSNSISASSSFYNQLLAMFSIADDEVTFEITGRKVVIRNYCLGSPCRPKTMRTQINLESTEFAAYQITKDTSVNFVLKPLRTVIHFAENFNLDVEFKFEEGGKPLSIVMKNPTFEVNFIVATLNPYSDANTSLTSATSAPCQVVASSGSEHKSDGDKENAPQSPQTKKAKTVFGRCYDATFHETVLGDVLAGNSDSD